VLSHMDSSCCEPTTGATAAAHIRVSFSYATRNQALRSPYICINSSGAASPGGTEPLPAVPIVAIFTPRSITSCTPPGTLPPLPGYWAKRSISSCGFLPDALAVSKGARRRCCQPRRGCLRCVVVVKVVGP
jgi:hypothetical protein